MMESWIDGDRWLTAAEKKRLEAELSDMVKNKERNNSKSVDKKGDCGGGSAG